MQGVFRSSRTAAVWVLIVVLLAPSTLASDVPHEVSLWDQFVSWLLGESGSTAEADEDGFTTWLNSRLGVPGG